MQKKVNLKCCLSSKTWAMIMALGNLAYGISIIIGGSIWMTHEHSNTFKLYFICGIFVGVVNIAAGCILISALIEGKESTVLVYILVEFMVTFVLTIFSAMNVYDDEFSPMKLGLLCLCPLIWIGLFNVYGFYLELHHYNNDTVQAGVDEIACNTHTNPLVSFPEKALDTTTV